MPEHESPGRRSKVKKAAKRVARKLQAAEANARTSDKRPTRAVFYLWRLSVQLVRQWRKDQCPQQAGGLAFHTVLSLVPVLAVILGVFRALGAMGAESSLVDFLAREYIVVSQAEISHTLLEWSDKISVQRMGIIGILPILLIAFITFNNLERTVNRIWRVEKRRSLGKRAATFFVTATLGPLFLGFSLYQASQFGLADGWAGGLLSAFMGFAGLFLVNFVLPATPVRVSAALVGAFVNALAAELAKLAFLAYISNFGMAKYAGIYGQLAVVPIFLIWIYWSWLMLLLGVEVTHAVQNYHLLEKSHHGQALSLADEFDKHVNANTAVRITTAIALAQSAGSDGLTRFQMAKKFDISDDVVRILTGRLAAAGILAKPGSDKKWRLAAPAKAISVRQIFDVFRANAQQAVKTEASDDLLSALLIEHRQREKALTIENLVAEQSRE
ncbi:MAG: YihY family inner membrane protein [Kofleriaceae bacterium]|nr:YihY family inner membrane protein [Kofleriaceae bacterium]